MHCRIATVPTFLDRLSHYLSITSHFNGRIYSCARMILELNICAGYLKSSAHHTIYAHDHGTKKSLNRFHHNSLQIENFSSIFAEKTRNFFTHF